MHHGLSLRKWRHFFVEPAAGNVILVADDRQPYAMGLNSLPCHQTVHGQPVHLAYRKDKILLISYPLKGVNFHVTIQSTDDFADALLRILTYPDPTAADAPARQ